MEGPRLFLRAPEPEDIDLLYRWENDTAVWKVSNTVVPFSRFTLEQYILTAHQDIYTTKQLRLMLESKVDSHAAVGTCDLFDFDPLHRRAGIGIMLIEAYRRRGYASEALEVMIEYAFKTLLLHQLYCNISEDNTPSLELFSKAGFIITGTKKQWMLDQTGWKDEHILQLINPLPA